MLWALGTERMLVLSWILSCNSYFLSPSLFLLPFSGLMSAHQPSCWHSAPATPCHSVSFGPHNLVHGLSFLLFHRALLKTHISLFPLLLLTQFHLPKYDISIYSLPHLDFLHSGPTFWRMIYILAACSAWTLFLNCHRVSLWKLKLLAERECPSPRAF